jgi:hypothetical protein
MAYEQRDNSGSVFVNSRKEKDNHPDRTGTAMIGGTEYWVNGWLKKTKGGEPFLSLSFKPKEESHAKGMQQARAAVDDFDDDELPF